MEKYNDIINDDAAFEKSFIRAMHRVGRERDKARIKDIRNLSSEEFREVIGARSGMKIPLRRRVIRYAAAACVACVLVLGGGFTGIQYSAYHQTINIGDRYLTEIPSDVSNIKGEVSENITAKLNMLFQNVSNGNDLKATIAELQEVYKLSADSGSEYNYVRNNIAWNLAMAHLKNGERNSAKHILENIIAEPDNKGMAIQESAQHALDELKSIISISIW